MPNNVRENMQYNITMSMHCILSHSFVCQNLCVLGGGGGVNLAPKILSALPSNSICPILRLNILLKRTNAMNGGARLLKGACLLHRPFVGNSAVQLQSI